MVGENDPMTLASAFVWVGLRIVSRELAMMAFPPDTRCSSETAANRGARFPVAAVLPAAAACSAAVSALALGVPPLGVAAGRLALAVPGVVGVVVGAGVAGAVGVAGAGAALTELIACANAFCRYPATADASDPIPLATADASAVPRLMIAALKASSSPSLSAVTAL